MGPCLAAAHWRLRAGDFGLVLAVLLAISDAVYQAAIAAILGISLAWINSRLGKAVKTVTETKELVNGSSIVQLRLYAKATHRIAELSKQEADIATATDVAELLAEREAEAAKAKLDAK